MSSSKRKKGVFYRIENWPPYFVDGEVPELRVGNPEAWVGVVTLWTPVDLIWEGLDWRKVAVAGQLKTSVAGVEGIIRTLASNRAIRVLVVCGREMKAGIGGQALFNLWVNGVDSRGNIIGCSPEARISPTIPQEEIQKFRSQVNLVDCRGVVDPKKVKAAIEEISPQKPYGEAVLLPLPKEKTKLFPRRIGAELVIAQTISEAYILVLEKILRFGPSLMTNYGQEAADVLNIITVTDEGTKNGASWQVFPFTRTEVEDYIQKNFLTKETPAGEWYTYGQRIFAFGEEKINQFEVIIRKLIKDRNDRGAIAVLYDPRIDKEGRRNPCLVSFQVSIEGNQLFLTAFFRSNDMANAWPWNAFGLRRIQEMIFDKIRKKYRDLEMGSMVTVSSRAHIYQSAQEVAARLVKEHRSEVKEGWDPKGNFIIKVGSGEIVAQLVSPDGSGRVLQEFRGKGAHELADILVRSDVLSQISHALEIGIHLGLAEEGIKK